MPGEWPSLPFNLVAVAGAENPLPAPVHLVRLDTDNAVWVGEQDAVITLKAVPGFKLEVKAGSVTFPDGKKSGKLSVTPVNADKVPMPPPNGMQPQFIVTIQPAGARFDPPARITLPNVDGRKPGAQVELYSFDHDLEEFVAVGLGTVSADGRVIESNPGVGVIKAGWFCGSPPADPGCVCNCGDCEVCLDGCACVPTGGNLDSADGKADGKDEDVVAFKTGGTTVNFTGTATGSNCDYDYNWDFGDGGTSNEQNPTHTYKDPEPKEYKVSLKVKCKKCSSAEKTDTIKVTLFKLKLKAVAFKDSLEIYKDVVGSAELIPVGDLGQPVWKDDNLDGMPEVNERIGYVSGKPVQLTAKFQIQPALSSPAEKVAIKAEGPDSLTFKASGLTLSGQEATFPVTSSDNPLPKQKTKFYNPMSIDWSLSTDGTAYVPIGTSTHKTYVTLSEKSTDTGSIYLTTLHLAVSNDGATDKTQAFLKSWQFFASQNLYTWDERSLYYYMLNHGFDTCATGIESLLTSDTASGGCSAFGVLLQEVLGINGINTEGFSVAANDKSSFLVKNWQFVESAMAGAVEGCQQELKLSEGGRGMVPAFPGDKYGDMLSEPGIPGQGEGQVTPSEKVFINHFLVKANTPGVGGPYFDASYGVTYTDAHDFQEKAIDGFTKLDCTRVNSHGKVETYIGVRKTPSPKLGDMFTFSK